MARKRMAQKINDSAEDVQESLSGYIDDAVSDYEGVRQGAADLVDTVKKKAASASQKLRAR